MANGQEPRRSARLTTYDSNGRDALAGDLGWTRSQLETWIQSPTVRDHLQAWYRLCIEGERRFNDAIEWINTGDKGYYYNPRDLEEDVFLACLSEGAIDAEENDGRRFDVEDARTGHWITQDLWARTAWRIVQANAGLNQVFEKRIITHPAWCYAFAIDMLCISFHSIAFRGPGSCYRDLIVGASSKERARWTAGRAAWVEKNGEEDSKVESVKSIYSESSFDNSEAQSSGSEVDSSESDMSVRTTAEQNNIMPRTLAALRQQEKHNAKAVNSGEVVPLSLLGLKKHTITVTKPCASKKHTVGTWLDEVNQADDANMRSVVYSDSEAETCDDSISEASTIILPTRKRVAGNDESSIGENIVVTSMQKRVKLATVAGDGALLSPPQSRERGGRR